MSEVISFRLDNGNPREKEALEILSIRCAEGFSVRYVITEALLKSNCADSEQTDKVLDELRSTLDQVGQLLVRIWDKDSDQLIKHDKEYEGAGLSDYFVDSIRKTAKIGVKIS